MDAVWGVDTVPGAYSPWEQMGGNDKDDSGEDRQFDKKSLELNDEKEEQWFYEDFRR